MVDYENSGRQKLFLGILAFITYVILFSNKFLFVHRQQFFFTNPVISILFSFDNVVVLFFSIVVVLYGIKARIKLGTILLYFLLVLSILFAISVVFYSIVLKYLLISYDWGLAGLFAPLGLAILYTSLIGIIILSLLTILIGFWIARNRYFFWILVVVSIGLLIMMIAFIFIKIF